MAEVLRVGSELKVCISLLFVVFFLFFFLVEEEGGKR